MAILARIGRIEVAAHQIAVVINRIAYLPGLAMGEAARILVGQALGARRLEAAEGAVRTAPGLSIAFMAMCGVSFAVFAKQFARFFTEDAAVASRVTHVLWIAGVFQVVDAAQLVMRGAREARLCALIGAAILWLTVPSLAYGLGLTLGLGVVGAWCAFAAQGALYALLFSHRGFCGPWRVEALTDQSLMGQRP